MGKLYILDFSYNTIDDSMKKLDNLNIPDPIGLLNKSSDSTQRGYGGWASSFRIELIFSSSATVTEVTDYAEHLKEDRPPDNPDIDAIKDISIGKTIGDVTTDEEVPMIDLWVVGSRVTYAYLKALKDQMPGSSPDEIAVYETDRAYDFE